MSARNKDVTDPRNWTDFVVDVSQSNRLEILKTLYEELDSEILKHHRFRKKVSRWGLAIRFVDNEELETVKKLIECVTDLELKYSINPKQTGDTEMSELSGWFSKLEKKAWMKTMKQWDLEMTDENIENLITLWHEMSQLALRALRLKLFSEQSKKQFIHQLLNMMAV